MADSNEQDGKKKSSNTGFMVGGLLFVGCLMLGKGIGHLYGDDQTGNYLGMGIGFLAMAGAWAYFRNK